MTVRVLVVEDSLTTRKYLCEVLARAPGIELVGEAENGKQAIEMCRALRPHVISMDMMLPLISGLSATEYIMAHFPTPILIVSASTNRGELFKTYEALAAGAVDALEKPRAEEPAAAWEEQFIGMLKLVSRIAVITHPRARLARRPSALEFANPSAHPAPASRQRYEIAAIGASTGGPGAIAEILRSLPAAFELPLLLVVHIGEAFAAGFADWLDGQTERRVSLAVDREPVRSVRGRVVVAPAGRHLIVSHGALRLTDDAERHSCKPAIDLLFESLAEEHGPAAIGCLLTGMGRDGALGLRRMRDAGALTVVQDEATCTVYGMPREAVLIQAAERILPLGEIGPLLGALKGPEERA